MHRSGEKHLFWGLWVARHEGYTQLNPCLPDDSPHMPNWTEYFHLHLQFELLFSISAGVQPSALQSSFPRAIHLLWKHWWLWKWWGIQPLGASSSHRETWGVWWEDNEMLIKPLSEWAWMGGRLWMCVGPIYSGMNDTRISPRFKKDAEMSKCT